MPNPKPVDIGDLKRSLKRTVKALALATAAEQVWSSPEWTEHDVPLSTALEGMDEKGWGALLGHAKHTGILATSAQFPSRISKEMTIEIVKWREDHDKD